MNTYVPSTKADKSNDVVAPHTGVNATGPLTAVHTYDTPATASVNDHDGTRPELVADATPDTNVGAGGTNVADNVNGSPALPNESTATTDTEYVPSGAPDRSTLTVDPHATTTDAGPDTAEH